MAREKQSITKGDVGSVPTGFLEDGASGGGSKKAKKGKPPPLKCKVERIAPDTKNRKTGVKIYGGWQVSITRGEESVKTLSFSGPSAEALAKQFARDVEKGVRDDATI